MSLNIILIQLVLLSCIVVIFLTAKVSRGWVVSSGLVLLVLAVAYYFAPAKAGWISGSVWVLLILLPMLGLSQISRLVAREQYGQARGQALYLRWLHPMDGLWKYPALLQALELGQQGKLEEAMTILNHHQTAKTRTGRMATALLYRMGARWQELLVWLQQNFSEEVLLRDAALGNFYLRSLGETGHLNEMLYGLEHYERSMEKTNNWVMINLARMFAFSFCGQPEQVKGLFAGSLRIYSQSIQEFWLATAELAAGNQVAGQAALKQLDDSKDAVLSTAITWRISQPMANPAQELTPSAQQILAQISTSLGQEAQYSMKSAFTTNTAYATYLLIGINLLVFVLETVKGGSSNVLTIYNLGGMVPASVLAGEWGRLLSANFLHFGIAHLTANMVSLYVFGSLVEMAFGRGRFLLCYFFSGVGAMLTITLLTRLGIGSPLQIVAGASGAVMGMLGALGAVLLQGWRKHNARIAARQLKSVVVVLALQTISDFLTPQVSMVGHLSGAILGFVAGMMLLPAGASHSDN